MKQLTQDEYEALAASVRELPLASISLTVREQLTDYLVNQTVHDLTPFGEKTPIRVWIENELRNYDAPAEASQTGVTKKPTPFGVTPARVGDQVLPRQDYRVAGGLVLIERIGFGASAEVWSARSSLRRDTPPLAVKLYTRKSGGDLTIGEITASAEAEFVLGVRHDNLVRIRGAGMTREHGAYLVMDYVPGLNLHEWVTRHGRLNERDAAQLAMVIARAVEVAHREGIIHRDIKPANLLGCGEALVPSAVVLGDFGISRHLSGTSSETRISGTPGFMAPEQVGGTVGPATDVFGLGVTVLWAISRGKLFSDPEQERFEKLANQFSAIPPGARLAEMRQQYVSILDPDKLAGKVDDPHLRAIIKKCLHPDPPQRYGSAAALADDLEAWLNDDLAQRSGYRYGLSERLRLLWRRARRPEERFIEAQADFWALGFVFFAVVSFLFIFLGAKLTFDGADANQTAKLASRTWEVFVVAMGAFIWAITKGRVGIKAMCLTILALIVAVEMMRECALPYDAGVRGSAIFIMAGLLYTVLGHNSPQWRHSQWLGWGMLILSPLASRIMQSPGKEWTIPVIVMGSYCLFFAGFAFNRLRPILYLSPSRVHNDTDNA
jgi:hypothetical protein